MDLRFFIICIGVLVAYAAIRTIRRGWLKSVVVVAVLVGIIQLGFDIAFPNVPANGPAVAATSHGDFFVDKVTQLESDRCMMSHLKDSPLSSIAYVLEMHRFLKEMKQLQTPEMKSQNNLGTLGRMVDESFGDADYTPGQSTVLVAASNASLCDKFTQWVGVEAQRHGVAQLPVILQGNSGAASVPGQALASPPVQQLTNVPAITSGVQDESGD